MLVEKLHSILQMTRILVFPVRNQKGDRFVSEVDIISIVTIHAFLNPLKFLSFQYILSSCV